MKTKLTSLTGLLLLILFATGCSSVTFTGTWKNNEKLTAKAYKTIFIAVLTEDQQAKLIVENDLASAIEAQGFKAVKSTDVFSPNFTNQNTPDENTMLGIIRSKGCDGILTATLLDQMTETRYVPGTTTYAPMPRYGYYGRYWPYYRQTYPVVYEPGYYTKDKTYFFENNFYDVADGELLFSMQSKTVNPSKLTNFSKEYAVALISQLKKEGIIK